MNKSIQQAAIDELKREDEEWARIESRQDIIGQNGNDGLVYQETRKVKPSHVLRAGAQHMEDRAATYDKPEGERSMSATVAAFGAVTGVEVTEEQGWLFMSILKIVRSQQGQFKLDNYEDGAAYFALAAEAGCKVRDHD